MSNRNEANIWLDGLIKLISQKIKCPVSLVKETDILWRQKAGNISQLEFKAVSLLKSLVGINWCSLVTSMSCLIWIFLLEMMG